jgi:mono/diheme cytochrome c family protein
MKRVVRPSALLLALVALASPIGGRARAEPDAAALYGQHCAACHGADRLGGTGPALVPEALVRLKPEAAKNVIAQGRPATQMPGFAATLAAPDIDALAAYTTTPLGQVPSWGAAQI